MRRKKSAGKKTRRAQMPVAAPVVPKRKPRSHPFSAVKPFLIVLLILFAAMYAIVSSGVRVSSLAFTLFALFSLLVVFGVVLAYLTQAREAEEELDYLAEEGHRSAAREFAEARYL